MDQAILREVSEKAWIRCGAVRATEIRCRGRGRCNGHPAASKFRGFAEIGVVEFFRIAEAHHADDDSVSIVFLGHVDEHLATRFVFVQSERAAIEVLPLLSELFEGIDAGRYVCTELAGFLSEVVSDDSDVEFAEDVEEFIRFCHDTGEDDIFLPFHGCTSSFLTASMSSRTKAVCSALSMNQRALMTSWRLTGVKICGY